MRSEFERELILIDDSCRFTRSTKIAIVSTLLVLLAVARIATIGSPRLDRTYWKEIDYIMISSNYWEHGYSFFSPEISWPAEPPRVTAMELPLVPFIASLAYPVLGVNAFSVRLLTLLAFLVFTFYIYRIASREYGFSIGIYAAVVSSILPLYHPFGRILFSEPWMMAMEVITIFHFARYVDEKRRLDLLCSIIAFTLAISLKITPLYLMLPLLWLAYRKYGSVNKSMKVVGGITAVSLILPVAWYTYAYYLTKHSIDVFGIFGGHDKFQTFSMLSDWSWYRIMYLRIFKGILLGKVGILLLVIGVLVSIRQKAGGIFIAYLVAILVFFAIVAEGNIDAPYRQLTIVPAFSGLIGIGIAGITMFMLGSIMRLGINVTKASRLVFCIGVILALSPAFISFYRSSIMGISDHPIHPREWELAKIIHQVKNSGTKIVTAGEYTIHKGGNDLSPVLYYYTGLQGWSLQQGDWKTEKIREYQKKGATLFVVTNKNREDGLRTFVESIRNSYSVIYEDEENIIFSLNKNLLTTGIRRLS